MEKDDAQLIHPVLSGDDSAFAILVEKYQKSIHNMHPMASQSVN